MKVSPSPQQLRLRRSISVLSLNSGVACVQRTVCNSTATTYFRSFTDTITVQDLSSGSVDQVNDADCSWMSYSSG